MTATIKDLKQVGKDIAKRLTTLESSQTSFLTKDQQTLTDEEKEAQYQKLNLYSSLFYRPFTKSYQGPIFVKTGDESLAVKAGTTFYFRDRSPMVLTNNMPVVFFDSLVKGRDYKVYLYHDTAVVSLLAYDYDNDSALGDLIGGFHFQLGRNADDACNGGDLTPSINPYSFWDLTWHPASSDKRGMALVANKFWCDIYLLNRNYNTNGTSCGSVRTVNADGSLSYSEPVIADGANPPEAPLYIDPNKGYLDQFNYYDVVGIATSVEKRLPTYEEYTVLAYGVIENSSLGYDPVTVQCNPSFTSMWGIQQATGCMWTYLDQSYMSGSLTWITGATQSRGDTYGTMYCRKGGGFYNLTTNNCGSRCISNQTRLDSSNQYTSARFVCNHVCEDV